MSQSPIEAAASVHLALKQLTAQVDELSKRNSDQEAELTVLRAENLKISKRLARFLPWLHHHVQRCQFDLRRRLLPRLGLDPYRSAAWCAVEYQRAKWQSASCRYLR